ncbi:type II DNA modification methyltransferase [Helicobacter pylori Shi169]|uniref:Type II DNA modification methyltransferase n=1 Tax=Helicobacter pylori Shi169 TaxID=1163741 RepID=A0A0E0WCW6_HELPX|nr:type II DNA modification methyltransferase [Helicobacter pylori Shi169]
MYQLDIKTLGQVFTPKNIVDFMLTLKHNHWSVLEPSTTNGRFLFSQRSLENALLPKDFLNENKTC